MAEHPETGEETGRKDPVVLLPNLRPTNYHEHETINRRLEPEVSAMDLPKDNTASSAPPRVLIAEDNPQGAELLEVYLSETDYDVRIAVDGEQTLAMVAEWKPDLILLDVMMPRISGFEVCKRLRKDPATQHIGILMVTALDQASDIDRAVEAGTDDFLSKPINKTELLLRVRSMLKSRIVQRDLDRALAYIQEVERGDS